MLQTRVFPILLFRDEGLYKGTGFADHKYVGDVVNAVRIFTSKQIDEIVLLDIGATAQGGSISSDLVRKVSTECLMPLTVGGGISCLETAKNLMGSGAEKITLNSHGLNNPKLVEEIASVFGNQSVVISIDAKRIQTGWDVLTHCGTRGFGSDPVSLAKQMENAGAGEILLTSIDREGSGSGYDLELISQVSAAVSIPVIANGGAGNLSHLKEGLNAGATALAAGSMFVFHGRRRAVLINFPSKAELEQTLK